MGWTQKFEKWDKPVTVFRSSFISKSSDEEPQPTPEKITDLMPTVQLDQMINQAGHYRADGRDHGIPLLNPCDSWPPFAETERKLNSGLDFLYSYWCDPDNTSMNTESARRKRETVSLISTGVLRNWSPGIQMSFSFF